jgi:hypothetical protein
MRGLFRVFRLAPKPWIPLYPRSTGENQAAFLMPTASHSASAVFQKGSSPALRERNSNMNHRTDLRLFVAFTRGRALLYSKSSFLRCFLCFCFILSASAIAEPQGDALDRRS